MNKKGVSGILIGIIVLAVVVIGAFFMFRGGNDEASSTSQSQEAQIVELSDLSAAEVKQKLLEINNNQTSYDITETSTKTIKGSSGPITLDMTITYSANGDLNRETKQWTYTKNINSNTNGQTEKSTWKYSLQNGQLGETINDVSQPSESASLNDYDIITRLINLLGNQQLSEEGNNYVLTLNPNLDDLLTAVDVQEWKDFSGTSKTSRLILSVNKETNLIDKAEVNIEFEEDGMNSKIVSEYEFIYQAKEQNQEQESNQNQDTTPNQEQEENKDSNKCGEGGNYCSDIRTTCSNGVCCFEGFVGTKTETENVCCPESSPYYWGNACKTSPE
jgi:hypothetical protein